MKKEPMQPLRKTSMNMTQLEDILQMLNVPSYYDLSGDECGCHSCFEHKDDSSTVYDSERGSHFDIKLFDNETDARLELLNDLDRLTWIGRLLIGLSLIGHFCFWMREHSNLSHDPEQALRAPGVISRAARYPLTA